MENSRWSKPARMLYIYDLLVRGKPVRKHALAITFTIGEKSVERDINALRSYFAECGTLSDFSPARLEINYCREDGCYMLEGTSKNCLSPKQILAMTRVLLECRAFGHTELNNLLEGLVEQSWPEERQMIRDIIRNEKFHYLPARHSELMIDAIWDLGRAVKEKRLVTIEYEKESKQTKVIRLVEPWSVLFSEYYFYLIAYIHKGGHDFPAVYRLDRITSYQVQEEHFRIDEAKRFEEGEFRKRVQFMQPGRLMKIRFRYWGKSLEAVLDRLPTAKVVEEKETGMVIEAEVFGEGIKMWLLSQGEYLEVLGPEDFRREIGDSVRKMREMYLTDYKGYFQGAVSSST